MLSRAVQSFTVTQPLALLRNAKRRIDGKTIKCRMCCGGGNPFYFCCLHTTNTHTHGRTKPYSHFVILRRLEEVKMVYRRIDLRKASAFALATLGPGPENATPRGTKKAVHLWAKNFGKDIMSKPEWFE